MVMVFKIKIKFSGSISWFLVMHTENSSDVKSVMNSIIFSGKCLTFFLKWVSRMYNNICFEVCSILFRNPMWKLARSSIRSDHCCRKCQMLCLQCNLTKTFKNITQSKFASNAILKIPTFFLTPMNNSVLQSLFQLSNVHCENSHFRK